MSLTLEERFEKMKEIRNDVLQLKESPLYDYRVENKYFPVVGEGSHTAHIMFIGEAPGKNEAETGRPFCGKSGKVLDNMLESIKLNRSDVYITNIVKDRPQENRDPTEEEIKLYAPFLERQIDIIQPEVIATLGRFSMNYIMNHFGLTDQIGPIGELHGKEFVAKASYGPIAVIPLYHPAVALYDGSNKETILKDFQVLTKYIK
ncbi:MAG: DNA polymerase bacteriophage-type [Parcubacteria group bacterium Gr01-1014_46]|nr:MAG: DNA polymerase bacteriophage-type [Parcubacteria group bacterium Gr01-1014_46]